MTEPRKLVYNPSIDILAPLVGFYIAYHRNVENGRLDSVYSNGEDASILSLAMWHGVYAFALAKLSVTYGSNMLHYLQNGIEEAFNKFM